MIFKNALQFGTLIKRYKRFFADIKMDSGEIITAHCPNTGSMKTCSQPGWRVAVSDSMNLKRKLRFTLEMIHNEKCWIGINTQLPNRLAKEAIENGTIVELHSFSQIKSEQKYGENSRIDLLLEYDQQKCYVEVKNVTLVENSDYLFPDAVTSRGLKHLEELLQIKRQGQRAVMLFVIQRSDGHIFKPAKSIDPQYAEKLKEVCEQGVEILPYMTAVSPEEINITHRIEFEL